MCIYFPLIELKRKHAERHTVGVRWLTPLLLQVWNKALTETFSWSVFGVGNGCLGQSPPDLLHTFFRANPGYGPCKRSPLLLTTLSGVRIFQQAISSELSNGKVVLKTSGDRMETFPATVCLLPVRYYSWINTSLPSGMEKSWRYMKFVPVRLQM